MTRWNAETDRALFFAFLEATSSKINYKAVAAAWPENNGEAPTPKAIRHRVSAIRSLIKSAEADCTKPSQPRSSNGVKRKRTGEVPAEVQVSSSREFLVLNNDAGRVERDGETPVGVKVESFAVDNDGNGREHVGREALLAVKAESPDPDEEEVKRLKVVCRASSNIEGNESDR